MTKQYPINDWEFVDNIETSFNEWFYSNHTDYSFKNEYFYRDCAVEDPKTREDLMRKWIYASFYSGYNIGRLSETKIEETRTPDELAQGLPKVPPDAL
jgi:hypothetical protein